MRWADAMQRALYGPDGFYRRAQPADHFRTSVTASPAFAQALAGIVQKVDAALGYPNDLDLIDVGAGDGRLVADLASALPPEVRSRVRAVAVEMRTRPPDLPDGVEWTDAMPHGVRGVVIANEYLDNVPCDVVEQTADGPRWVLVDPQTGSEQLGPPVDDAARAWLTRWWPLPDGGRAEVGAPRDAAWSDVVGSLEIGLAIAVDYGHIQSEREDGAFPGGTLTGYRSGRQVPPVPDGTCDLTAHVAMDACAAAGVAAGATTTQLTHQADALRDLGVRPERPNREQAGVDPLGYVESLSRAAHVRELLDPASLGSFWWLSQRVGIVGL